MKWTREKPSRIGWYWYRSVPEYGPPDTDGVIGRVGLHTDVAPHEQKRERFWFHSMYRTDVVENMPGEWSDGPLPWPDEQTGHSDS